MHDDMQDQSHATGKPNERGRAAASAAQRPADIPEKFWDGANGEIRVQALLKSYLALERQLHDPAPQGTEPLPDGPLSDETRARLLELLGRPPSPDQYTIVCPHELIDPDPEINGRLHEAGFSQAQAQLVYELAVERLLPMIGEVIGEVEARRHTERLERHYGGPEAWRKISRQIQTWARSNLEPSVFEVLAASADGVLALHQMMRATEPQLLDADGGGALALSEDALRDMVRDPRYWRDRDADFIGRVTDGYRRLFPT